MVALFVSPRKYFRNRMQENDLRKTDHAFAREAKLSTLTVQGVQNVCFVTQPTANKASNCPILKRENTDMNRLTDPGVTKTEE